MKFFFAFSLLFTAVYGTYDFIKWQIHEPIDLTWQVDEFSSIDWPGHKAFIYTRRLAGYDESGQWYAMNEFCASEHGGTHMDAPYHYNKNGWKVGDIPVQRLLTHAVVIDMSDTVQRLGPTVELLVTDLLDWERINGPLPPHCVILVRFGWSDYYYQSRQKYLGINGTVFVFPGISEEAAQWLVETRKIVGVGVDTASVDSGLSTTFSIHRIFAAHNIYNIENLNLPRKLPARGFNLIIMPMRLKEGSGSPIRIVAIPSITLDPEYDCEKLTQVPWYGHTSVVLCSFFLLIMYTINCFTL